MREINFRGRQRHGKKAGTWWYGPVHIDDVDGSVRIYTGTVGWIEVDPETVGQFTGVKDAVGMKIWEGDIFRCSEGEDLPAGDYAVGFREGSFIGTLIDGTNQDETWLPYWFEGSIELVGTIHQAMVREIES